MLFLCDINQEYGINASIFLFCRIETMTETFKKLKKKYLLIAIAKSAIVGVFSALFAVGAVMLGIKLGAVWIPSYAYVIIAFGTLAIAFGITFLLTYHNDKSLSKYLDSEYGLKEKVQTMVEFSDQEGDMLKIQREDAEHRLQNLPKLKLSFAKIWQYVLVVVLGLTFILTGALVPSRYIPPTVSDDGDYVLSEWDSKVLDQLISEVKSSDLTQEVMLPVSSALELLKEQLANVKTNAAMRQAVSNCAKAVDEAIILANSYRDIALTINSYTELNDLKRALVNASNSYQTENEIISMSMVKDAQKTSEEKIRTALGVFADGFSGKVKNLNEKADIKDAVDNLFNPLNESFADDEIIQKLADDDLFGALSHFSEAMGPFFENDEYLWRDDSDLKSTVSNACSEFVSSASKAMVVQVYNRMMDDYIFNKLEEIFSVVLSQQELELPGVSGDDIGSEDNPSHGGGVGDTDIGYGGNDAVYDHNSAEHVPYGDVWNDYVKKLYERINDEQSDLSEEMKAYILEYIKILDGSASDTEGN